MLIRVVKCRIQEVWQEEEVNDGLKNVWRYVRHRGRRRRQELVRIHIDMWTVRARDKKHRDPQRKRRSMEFSSGESQVQISGDEKRFALYKKNTILNHHTSQTRKVVCKAVLFCETARDLPAVVDLAT